MTEILSRNLNQLDRAGVLDRVKTSLLKHRGTQDPTPTNIEIVDVVTEEERFGEGFHTQVVVAMDRNGKRVTQAFGVREGKSFGAADEAPLTDEQYQLVMSLARKEAENNR